MFLQHVVLYLSSILTYHNPFSCFPFSACLLLFLTSIFSLFHVLIFSLLFLNLFWRGHLSFPSAFNPSTSPRVVFIIFLSRPTVYTFLIFLIRPPFLSFPSSSSFHSLVFSFIIFFSFFFCVFAWLSFSSDFLLRLPFPVFFSVLSVFLCLFVVFHRFYLRFCFFSLLFFFFSSSHVFFFGGGLSLFLLIFFTPSYFSRSFSFFSVCSPPLFSFFCFPLCIQTN